MTAFNPSGWVRRLEAIGGHVRAKGDGWVWCAPFEDDMDELAALTAEIRAPENAAAVRQYVSGRP